MTLQSPPGRAGIGILFETDSWLSDLFRSLTAATIPYDPIDVRDAVFGLQEKPSHPLYFNRVSPSSYIRGNGQAIRFTIEFLRLVEAQGYRVINGSKPFTLETSKVAQLQLLTRLGVRTPSTMIFNNREQIRRQAPEEIFPAILKPDMGGSGAHVQRVDTPADLERLLDEEENLFGPEQLLLLQKYIPAADGTVVRTEFVDGELVYAMRVKPTNTYNLCPAISCERTPARPVSEAGTPAVEFIPYRGIPDDAVAQAREIVREARLDVGGVEYIQTADGQRFFYDINATSFYREEICHAWGIDGMAKLVAFVDRERRKELAKQGRSGPRPELDGPEVAA